MQFEGIFLYISVLLLQASKNPLARSHLRVNSQVGRVDFLHHLPGRASAFLPVRNGNPVKKV